MNPSTLMLLRLIQDHAPAPLAPLALAMAVSAITTGERIDEGERVGVRQSEETVTESVLLDLAQAIPSLRIRTLTRAAETREGADWEWWIQGPGGWFHFLVQAKRIHFNGSKGGYDLGYRPQAPKNRPRRPRQIDTLLQSARMLGAPAIYTLYNQVRAAAPYADPPCFCAPAIPSGIDGITALSALVARRLLPSDGVIRAPMVPVSEVRRHAAPWSCLATCGGYWQLPYWLPPRFGPPGPPWSSDPALAARDFVLSLDLRDESAGRENQDWETPALFVDQGFREERGYYVPAREPEALDSTNLPPHPLREIDAAPTFVAALYQE